MSFGAPKTLQMQALGQHQPPRATSNSSQAPRPAYNQYSSSYSPLSPPSRAATPNSDLGFVKPSSSMNSQEASLRPLPPYPTTTTQIQRQALPTSCPGDAIEPAPRQPSLNGIAKKSTVIDSSNLREPARYTSNGNARQAERLESTHIIASPEWTAPSIPSPDLSGTGYRTTAIAGSATPPTVKTSLTAPKGPIATRPPTTTRSTGSSATQSPPKLTSTPLPTGKQHGAHTPKKSSPVQDKKLRNALCQTTSQPSDEQNTTPATQSPPMIPDMYPGLPCMDCGEDIGHKSDCYIGSKTLQYPITS